MRRRSLCFLCVPLLLVGPLFLLEAAEQPVQAPLGAFRLLGGVGLVDGLLHKHLLAVAGGQGVDLPAVGAVRQQGAGLHIVPQLGVEDPQQLLPDLRVVDGAHDLHPAVQVPGHHIGGRDEHLRAFSPAKAVDAPVLQIAAHDAGHMDIFRPGGNPRTQAADAPQDQLDLHPGAGRLRELIHDLPLRNGVGLDADIALLPLGDLSVHHPQQLGLQAHGSDIEMRILAVQIAHQHVLEEDRAVQADVLVGGHQA